MAHQHKLYSTKKKETMQNTQNKITHIQSSAVH